MVDPLVTIILSTTVEQYCRFSTQSRMFMTDYLYRTLYYVSELTLAKRISLKSILLAISIALMLSTSSASFSQAVAHPAFASSDISCGQSLTQSTKLSKDIGPCSNYGVQIGADNITLDCAGHSIIGNITGGTYYGFKGIYSYGRNNVKIENCRVTSFVTGYYFDNTNSSTLLNNTALDNLQGFNLWQSNHDVLRLNNATDNSYGGYSFPYSTNDLLIRNNATIHKLGCTGCAGFEPGDSSKLTGNSDRGYYVGFYIGNNDTVLGNTATKNAFDGFEVLGSNSVISGNMAANNSYDGIQLYVGSGNVLAKNTALGNSANGYEISSSNNTAVDNRAIQNGQDGFSLWGNRTQITISHNLSYNNWHYGFAFYFVYGDQVSLNSATGNGYSGFYFSTLSKSNFVQHNVSTKNLQYGFDDISTGTGTDGTGNTYGFDKCANNSLGGSTPSGLCATP